jgi:hypothetical protein
MTKLATPMRPRSQLVAPQYGLPRNNARERLPATNPIPPAPERAVERRSPNVQIKRRRPLALPSEMQGNPSA